MQLAAMTSEHYEKLSDDNKAFLSSLINSIDYQWNVRDEKGNLDTDKKGNYKRKEDNEIDEDLN
jgi:hypothetical protein